MIVIKSKREIELMRKAGFILAKILMDIKNMIRPGITTKEINDYAEGLIESHNAVPAFKGYRGFPSSICVSVNEEVVHGIPDQRKINVSDIVSVDVGIKFGGYYADAAFTQPIGKVDSRVQKLVDITKKSLSLGIQEAHAGNYLSDISCSIQRYVEANGFSVVRDFVGHGIGKDMHEEPEIPNFGSPKTGPVLREGMTLAIEPMVNMGTWEVEIAQNNWTAITKDRKPSAHFEHTIAITEKGPEILTQ